MRRLSILLALWFVADRACGADRYFPEGSLSTNADTDEWVHKRYVEVFNAFDEPSLLKLVEKGQAKSKRIFRLTWLRSFDNPVCITLTAGDQVKLTLKELERETPKRKLGRITRSETLTIDSAAFKKFTEFLDDAEYWQMEPATITNGIGGWHWSEESSNWIRSYGSGLDGATWMLEYCRDDEYFFVERWSPIKTRFGKACQELIKLSGLAPKRVY